jgi:hypothetical protein
MAVNPPITQARTSHAITIRVNGKTIGAIQSWNTAQTRGLTQYYELNAETSGEVVETVPGNLGGQSLSVSRYDLYTDRMEEVFGARGVPARVDMLSDYRSSFDVFEITRFPDGTAEAIVYIGCWFSNIGRNHSSTGDRMVLVNATLQYTRKKRIAL